MACWVVWHPGTWRSPWRGDGRLHIVSIDVGQGDATLIELPDRSTVLVDAGGLSIDARYDIGARVVAPAMWARGIGWLDALLLAHGDPDHIGGAECGRYLRTAPDLGRHRGAIARADGRAA
jgi:competence protein ComEC